MAAGDDAVVQNVDAGGTAGVGHEPTFTFATPKLSLNPTCVRYIGVVILTGRTLSA
jgi:hypothetical protein